MWDNTVPSLAPFLAGLGSGVVIGAYALLLYRLRQDELCRRRDRARAKKIRKAAERSLAVRAARARLGHDSPGSWGIGPEGRSIFDDLWDPESEG